jgi:hypothetical protein
MICFTNDHVCVPPVVGTSRPYPHSWLCNWSNTMGVTSGAGFTYLSGAQELTSGCGGGSCCLTFSFLCNVLKIVVCPFVLWSLCCLSFFDLRILTAPLVSSNSSYTNSTKRVGKYKADIITISSICNLLI